MPCGVLQKNGYDSLLGFEMMESYHDIRCNDNSNEAQNAIAHDPICPTCGLNINPTLN
jgi:hypothetical protein